MNFATLTTSLVGTNTSDAINLGGASIIAVLPGTGWVGTALTFKATIDGVTFGDVQDDLGAAISLVVAAGKYTLISPSVGIAMDTIKLVSGSSETASISLLVK